MRLDDEAARSGFAVLVKTNARFTHAASWGSFGLTAMRMNPLNAVWFLRTFYQHAIGFLGWNLQGLAAALEYVPGRAVDMGRVPAAGAWARVETPLERIGAAGRLLDGVGFIHARGRVQWGRTSLVAPGGDELEQWTWFFFAMAFDSAHEKRPVGHLSIYTRSIVLNAPNLPTNSPDRQPDERRTWPTCPARRGAGPHPSAR
jgi:hypothetical protein